MSEDDEHFNQAFGEHTGISKDIRKRIDNVRQLRHVSLNRFTLYFSQSERFTHLSWTLLGRYIANNNHLEGLVLGDCGVTDERMALLFSGLVGSTSITKLWLAGNEFGVDGLRSMAPFLQNSPDLVHITLSRNNNINTECFELLLQTLHRRPYLECATLEFQLSFSECGITNISALERYPLQNLSTLHLEGNNIGREGCITISNLLQQEGSNLNYLHLGDTGIDDEGAEIIASSLKHNTKLRTFLLEESHRRASDNPASSQTRNNITERGYKAFLKLIFDVSSIENMYKSNHTLRALYLPECIFGQECKHIIKSIYEINSNELHAAVKAKVIKYQLNNQKRKDLCRLQGVEYTSIGNLFPDIEPILLPRILALIGSSHGHSEFYRALIPMVPDLMSCVDTSGMRRDLISQNSIQMAELARQQAVLAAKNDQLSRILAVREESGVSRQSTNVGSTVASGKKRQRS